ncbi:MAG: ADP-ribosylglycohydrolase family protein [Kiritimatiellae bacterium]|nr:ADP-ribosylglycohydrolase family protein [Kiritimatiellia bacterium]
MYDTIVPSAQKINLATYRDKVFGCWTGKNIGGTLGTPFEGKREVNDVTFYVQDLGGNPAPNDDLDLQLVWLQAAEEQGLYKLTPRILGEYWVNCIVGPWNEYGVCKANIVNGLYPPLSGSCNNDTWKYSNGAWIRSEIWACLFPGSPDDAAEFAYIDSCCDHCGEGIYAEVFTATTQSAAFVVSDVRKLIEIGLSKIPQDCRIARSVNLACELFDKGTAFKSAREAIVKDNADLGWFQAPGNIGFVMLGLLYGKGDFGKSVCLATNCGDDTDCTAATVGALLGIINGRSGLPKKWIEPIGNKIQTIAINAFGMEAPKTLDELTERVVRLALTTQRENPVLPQITPGATDISEDYLAKLTDSKAVERRVWKKSPYALVFDLPYAKLAIDYENGPSVSPGEEKRLAVIIGNPMFVESIIHIDFKLPEGWRALPGQSASICCKKGSGTKIFFAIVPGTIEAAFTYVPLEVRLAGRFNPIVLQVPFQLKGAVVHSPPKDGIGAFQEYWDGRNRRLARANVK